MNWKTAVVLLVLAAGLGGFYAYDTYTLGPARDKRDAEKGRLWLVEPKDVEGLAIARGAETIRARRVESGWELTEPVKWRGDRATLDDVVTTLAMARADREVDPNPAKPADFGLDPPQATVTLDVKGRTEPLRLAVGGKSPTGVWVYAREAGKTAVVTLGASVARDTERPLVDFRDKTLLAFDRKNVSGLDLEVAGDRIGLVAEEGGTWRMVAPREYRADAETIGEFLEKVEQARVAEFVAETADRAAAYGLDRPTRVTLWLGRDKERSSRTLLLGRVDPEQKGVYVMRDGEPAIMRAPGELWTALPRTVAALRDKVVVAYAADKLTRVELAHARGTAILEKDGGTWKLTAPEALKADPGAVNALLWRLRDLRASGFLADGAEDVPRHLGTPDVTVKLWEEGATAPKTLLLRASRETRGGQPAAIAAVAGQGPVMLVDGKAVDDLARTALDLRDKTVLPAFEASDVKRAQITAGGKRVVAERTGDSDWRLLEPAKKPAAEAKVTNLLLALKALRWKEIASPDGGDPARFGLDQPEAVVTLAKADGGELATLEVGRRDGDRTYVRVKGAAAVYAVESKAVDDVRRAPAEL
jgi:hypothetical protein